MPSRLSARYFDSVNGEMLCWNRKAATSEMMSTTVAEKRQSLVGSRM